MAVNVGDVFEVTYFHHMEPQGGLIVRHWKVTAAGGGGPSEQACADVLSADFGALIPPLLTNGARYEGLTFQKINVPPLPVRTVSINGATNGLAGANPMSTQVCGVIALRTALANRNYRGRAYLPFPDESDNISGAPGVAYRANATLLAALLITPRTVVVGGTDATFQPVLWSRQLNVFTNLTSYLVRSRWGTQRRRGPFGARNTPLGG